VRLPSWIPILATGLLLTPFTAFGQLEASFSLPKTTYAVGEPIILQYSVKNTSKAPIEIYIASPNSFCSGYSVKVENEESEPSGLCDYGIGGSCLSSSATLKPGETRVEQYFVNDEWLRRQHSGDSNLTKPGRYRITAARRLHYGEDAKEFMVPGSGAHVEAHRTFGIEIADPKTGALQAAFAPLLAELQRPEQGPNYYQAVNVVATLAPPFLEDFILSWRQRPSLRGMAITALRNLNTEAARAQLADIAMHPENDGERYAAVSALGDSGDRQYLAFVLEIARGVKPGELSGYASAVGKLGGDKALPWFRELLASRDPLTRGAAINGLAETGARGAVPLLIDLFSDPDEQLASSPEWALGRLTHYSSFPNDNHVHTPAQRGAKWLAWWTQHGSEAPIYTSSIYCRTTPLP